MLNLASRSDSGVYGRLSRCRVAVIAELASSAIFFSEVAQQMLPPATLRACVSSHEFEPLPARFPAALLFFPGQPRGFGRTQLPDIPDPSPDLNLGCANILELMYRDCQLPFCHAQLVCEIRQRYRLARPRDRCRNLFEELRIRSRFRLESL